jgi:hypothetical protein
MKTKILLLTTLLVGLFIFNAAAQTPVVKTKTETIDGSSFTASISYLPGQLYSTPAIARDGGSPVYMSNYSHSPGTINVDKFYAVVDGWEVYVTITGNFSIGWQISAIEAIVP